MEILLKNSKDQVAQVEQLKAEWKRLWKDHFDDKNRAEGIASEDFSSLFVEKGTVIFATRNFKLLTLKEILEEHGLGDLHKFVSPSPAVGGWGKFIKTSITHGKPNRGGYRRVQYFEEEKKPQQLRKGGRGWLHV
jgi:hypothetical protein